MNYFHQCRECTIELSNVKLLPVSQLDAHWEYNWRSFLNYIEQTLYGVRGFVTDSETGDPVKAKIFIEGHDIDSSHVWSDAVTGNYNRLLFEGNYDISYKASGYKTKVIEDVNVENYQVVILDVELEAGDLIADFEADNTIAPAGSSVHFYDKSYGNITSRLWIFEGGDPATSGIENPVVTYDEPGNYDVSLVVSDGNTSDTLIRSAYISVNLEYRMDNGAVTTNSGLFYDSGGNEDNYSDNENYIMVFYPSEGCDALKVEFASFNVEWESSCNYDWLSIYDGNSVEAPLIGTYCGTSSPGTVVATNAEGALTFQFHSDSYVTEAGWVAEILCDSSVGENSPADIPQVSVYPNPSGDRLVIESDGSGISGSHIRISNMNGELLFDKTYYQTNTSGITIDVSKWPGGIYTLEFLSGEKRTVRKIIVL
jgi:PKD repeat protein